MRLTAAPVVSVGLALALAAPAHAIPSEPGVVNYAVMGKGSVGNIVGATMRWENFFSAPFQAYWVDVPECNNWADIGLPEAAAMARRTGLTLSHGSSTPFLRPAHKRLRIMPPNRMALRAVKSKRERRISFG